MRTTFFELKMFVLKIWFNQNCFQNKNEMLYI